MTATHPQVGAAPVATEGATYVYGVVRHASPAAGGCAGVGGAAVESIAFRDLAALTSSVPRGPVRARRRDVLAYSNVLTAAVGAGTVLPLRFGTVFESADAVMRRFLEPRYAELDRLLDELENLVELRVTGFYRREAVLEEIVRDSPRVAQLREATRGRPDTQTHGLRIDLGAAVAAELQARRERDAALVVERVRPLAEQVVVDEALTDEQVLRASFLVRRHRVVEFDSAMDGLARESSPRLHFKYLGPLAPHSFVALAPEER